MSEISDDKKSEFVLISINNRKCDLWVSGNVRLNVSKMFSLAERVKNSKPLC
jgi:hypothetical protein